MRGGFLDDTFVVLAGRRVSLPRPVVLPLRAALARSEGIAIAGLLGAGFLSRHVVDLDYATGTLTIHDPETFVYRGAGSPINLAIEQGHAYITAGLELPDGRRLTARLLVDTGWRNAVAFAAPFVKAERLLDAVPRHVRVVAGVGIGGPTRDRIGRVAAIQLGRHRLERVVVTMSDAGAGVLATDQFAGILGGEILKRFRVVIDYPHGRMFLETTAATAQPFDFDMSGMFLVSDGHRQQTHTVFSVTPGSAASDAQLREGDVIEQFAGASAESLTLEEIRRAFSGPAGKSIPLRVRRGSQRFDVTLILRPLV
jgi:hypothetical protein